MVISSKKNRVDSEKFQAYWIDDNTIYFNYFEDALIDIEDIVLGRQFQIEQEVGPQHKRIIHAEQFVSLTTAARKYLEQNEIPVAAEAYVIPSLSQKIIFGLFLRFKKSKHPAKAFDKLDEAVAWLNKL